MSRSQLIYKPLTLALDATLKESDNKRAAMITKRRRYERVRHESMRNVQIKPLSQHLNDVTAEQKKEPYKQWKRSTTGRSTPKIK